MLKRLINITIPLPLSWAILSATLFAVGFYARHVRAILYFEEGTSFCEAWPVMQWWTSFHFQGLFGGFISFVALAVSLMWLFMRKAEGKEFDCCRAPVVQG